MRKMGWMRVFTSQAILKAKQEVRPIQTFESGQNDNGSPRQIPFHYRLPAAMA